MPSLDFTEDLAQEYNRVFALAKIRPEHDFEVNVAVTRVLQSETRRLPLCGLCRRPRARSAAFARLRRSKTV